jgi:cysteinyl-tRNA synthetase
MVQKILKNGYAYEVDGTVYFEVEKYNKEKPYGILTNRKLEDMLEGTRELSGQDEKKGRLDFALWIKAKPEHLMQWPSPWGMGFPGWHIECSAMSEKYLGKQFDIHGGGMDLAATHHTNEIAQSQACYHISPVNYWLHTNMLTVNGARMSKSAGNGFLPHQLFTGDHPLLERAYSPMTVRFFMLQTHYRSTLDFSNEALQAAEKGFRRLWEAYQVLMEFKTENDEASNAASSEFNAEQDAKVTSLLNEMDEFMNDDFHTSRVLANMFDLMHVINGIKDKHVPLGTFSSDTIRRFQEYFRAYLEDIFGLKDESGKNEGKLTGVVELLIEIRKEARVKKDYATSDKIRNQLTGLGIVLKDEKDGSISYSFA